MLKLHLRRGRVQVLVVLQSCTRNGNEELAEAVPETVKNMLLVMATRQILAPDWTVRGAGAGGWGIMTQAVGRM